MRQFYEFYKEDGIVSPLVRQIDWTHHLIVMARAKSPDERRFYIEKSKRAFPPRGWSEGFTFTINNSQSLRRVNER